MRRSTRIAAMFLVAAAAAAQSVVTPAPTVTVRAEVQNAITATDPGARVRFSVAAPPANADSMVVLAPDQRPIAASVNKQFDTTAVVYGAGTHRVKVELYDAKGKIVGEGRAAFVVKSDIQHVDNGITVGIAKQFDDRSLVGMLRDVETALQTHQASAFRSVGDAVGRVQGQTTDRSSFGVSLSTLPIPGIETTTGSKITDTGATASTEVKTEAKPDATTTTTTAKTADPSQNVESTVSEKVTQAAVTPLSVQPPAPSSVTFTQSTLGMGAEDLLAEQTNLAAQYINLRLLLQRSLSDRVVIRPNGMSQHRSQPVYGFQISLDPPPQYRDAVAEAIVTVSLPPDDASGLGAPRLVTLLPKEKTYNVASIMNRSRAFSLGAVVQVVNAGVGFNRSRETLYVVKDTDTVALERPANGAAASNSISFAWQFRPVLGKRVVDPGTRQVFAVLALPTSLDETWDGVVTVQTRWRKFNAKTKTAGAEIKSSSNVQEPYRISVSRLLEQERAVASSIEDLEWSEAGTAAAIVTVNGHFPEGTRVSVADSIIDRPASGMLLQTPRRISFVVSAERLFYNPALVDSFGVATPLLDPQNAKRPPFEIVAAGPEEKRFAVYLRRTDLPPMTFDLLSPATVYRTLRAQQADQSLELVKPLALIGHTVFGFSNAPITMESVVTCNKKQNDPLCTSVGKYAKLTKLTFDVPKAVLQEARVVRVIDPFSSYEKPAEAVITFPEAPRTVTIGELHIVGFSGENTHVALSGKALDEAVDLTLRAGASDCSLLNVKSESLVLFSCETAALENAARAIVTLARHQPKLLAIPPLPSGRVRITSHEAIREGESRPVRLDGNDVSTVVEAHYNGIPMRVTRDREERSTLYLDVPATVTSSPGEKVIQLLLADGKVLRTTLTVSAKPKSGAS